MDSSSDSPDDMLERCRQFVRENSTTALVGLAAASGGLLLSYLLSGGKSRETVMSNVDFDDQSVCIGGRPDHRGSNLSKGEDLSDFDRMITAPGQCQTVYDSLQRGKRESDNGPCLGARTGPNREFEWMSYQEVIDKVNQFGSALLHKGLKPSTFVTIGIFASNRPEWCIADFGSQSVTMVPVPVYDSLGHDACKYIMNECEMSVCVVDTPARLQNLVELKDEVPTLKLIIAVETVAPDTLKAAQEKGLDVVMFDEFLDLGKKNLQPHVPPKPTDIFSICYTSGTTGNPKGVMITQNAFVTSIDSINVHGLRGGMKNFTRGVHLAYLPLAHNFERGSHVLMLSSGARIGYFSRDVTLLLDDLATLKPTVFMGVPRIFNRIYDAVMVDVKQSKIKTTLLNWALASKTKEVNKRIIRRDSFWDKILFRKIQNKLGGRVETVISGSAPLSPEVMKFLRCSFGCHVVEGYGQTEATIGVTFGIPGDVTEGGVGVPLPGMQVKLDDVPEMEYYTKNNIGEICAKSGYLFSGYYKQPEKTAEVLGKDGWLHTGDIGCWLPNGCLKVVDRKKHIFKLSQGEYIAPEKIENIYRISPFVSQCFVDGNSLKNSIMAIVVPDPDYIAKTGARNNLPTDMESFCESKAAYEVVFQSILDQGKAAKLKGFEQVKDIYMESNLFSVDNGLLTPTLKNKRPLLRVHYKSKFDELYKKHGQ